MAIKRPFMKITSSWISSQVLTMALLPTLGLLLTSCNTKENLAAAKSLNEKAELLHKEADQLAGEASLVQAKIKNLGAEDETGPAVISGLEKQLAELLEEQSRLTTIGKGLTDALAKLESERSDYAGKYSKP